MLLFELFCLMKQCRTKGEGWSTASWLVLPGGFVAVRSEAALLLLLGVVGWCDGTG